MPHLPPNGTYLSICNSTWGEPRYKPTDTLGAFPKKMRWNPVGYYEKAPRGSRTGTQGLKTPEERAKIPYGLSETICIACEKE